MGGEAWIGLAGVLGGVLVGGVLSYGVPFIQGWIAARNAEAGKLYEQRLSAYVDAMSYAHHVEARVTELTEHPDVRSSRRAMEVPHEDLISARLRLVAPPEVIQPWTELLDAWRALAWNVQEDITQHASGEFYVDAASEDVRRVMTAITAVARSLRRAMGVAE